MTIVFFDERFNYVAENSTALRVYQQGDNAAPLVLANIKTPKNGFAYIYLSNESAEPVYFDDFTVSDNRGRIIEEDHYYAYGLKIAGISSKKLGDVNEGLLDNKNLYNDKELFDDADIDWYDYGYRNYDAQIGRFPQLDPLTDDYPELTNYQYASNDPIANVDMDGLEALGAVGTQTGVITAQSALKEISVSIKIGAKSTSGFFSVTGNFFKGVGNGIRSFASELGNRASINFTKDVNWVKGTFNTLATNAKTNWASGNTLIQQLPKDFLENPLEFIEGGAEADLLKGVGIGEKSIVIGEGMDAVKSAAKDLQSKGINAKWYQAWSKNIPTDRLLTPKELEGALLRQERWITTKIKQGYKVYDIGIDATRVNRSPFYQLEKNILNQKGHPVSKLPR